MYAARLECAYWNPGRQSRLRFVSRNDGTLSRLYIQRNRRLFDANQARSEHNSAVLHSLKVSDKRYRRCLAPQVLASPAVKGHGLSIGGMYTCFSYPTSLSRQSKGWLFEPHAVSAIPAREMPLHI